MPHFVWIIIAKDMKYFSSIYIPFDCQFFVIKEKEDYFEILEIYRTEANTTSYSSEFGTWDDVRGLKVDGSNFDFRRDNLSGDRLLAYQEKVKRFNVNEPYSLTFIFFFFRMCQMTGFLSQQLIYTRML